MMKNKPATHDLTDKKNEKKIPYAQQKKIHIIPTSCLTNLWGKTDWTWHKPLEICLWWVRSLLNINPFDSKTNMDFRLEISRRHFSHSLFSQNGTKNEENQRGLTQNQISCVGGQDRSAWHIVGHSSHQFSRRCPETPIWSISLSQNGTNKTKINTPWTKSNQFWKWSGYISMPNFTPFLVLSLFHVPNGFTMKHETSARCRVSRIMKQSNWFSK